MADAYFEIEEYLWLSEAIQGNVNVAGLVFDDIIEDGLGLGPEEVLTVFVEQLEDSLDLVEAFDPYHEAFVNDTLGFHEQFGTPLRVRQSVLNLIMTSPLTPAIIAHIHLDVLHGVDIFWEEVSSELQCHSSYANAVPYYWEWIYESLDIDMTEPQPEPPIILVLYLEDNDLVNMRHEVEQEYFFNSKCFEEFFIWDGYAWGWDHLVESPLVSAETIQEIIGKVADEYLYLQDGSVPKVKVVQIMDERFFIFDAGTHEKYYLLTAADTIAIMDGEVSFVAVATVGTVNEALGISETASPQTAFMKLATESLVFADVSNYVQELIIEEGLAMGDVELSQWVFNVLIESGCNVADIIG